MELVIDDNIMLICFVMPKSIRTITYLYKQMSSDEEHLSPMGQCLSVAEPLEGLQAP